MAASPRLRRSVALDRQGAWIHFDFFGGTRMCAATTPRAAYGVRTTVKGIVARSELVARQMAAVLSNIVVCLPAVAFARSTDWATTIRTAYRAAQAGWRTVLPLGRSVGLHSRL